MHTGPGPGDQPLLSTLHQLVREGGNIDEVRRILNEHPEFLNAELDLSVLIEAVLVGRTDILEFLLTLPDLNVNQKSTKGALRAINIASNNKLKGLLKARLIKDIFEKPIDEAQTILNDNILQPHDESKFHFTYEDYFTMLKQLKGQDKPSLIKIIDSQLLEIFIHAARHGPKNVVERMLFQKPSLLHKKNKMGSSALDIAHIAENDEIKELLKARLIKDFFEKPIAEAEKIFNDNIQHCTYEDYFAMLEQLQGQGKPGLVKIIDNEIVEEFVRAARYGRKNVVEQMLLRRPFL